MSAMRSSPTSGAVRAAARRSPTSRRRPATRDGSGLAAVLRGHSLVLVGALPRPAPGQAAALLARLTARGVLVVARGDRDLLALGDIRLPDLRNLGVDEVTAGQAGQHQDNQQPRGRQNKDSQHRDLHPGDAGAARTVAISSLAPARRNEPPGLAGVRRPLPLTGSASSRRRAARRVAKPVATGERGYQIHRHHRDPGAHPVARGRFVASTASRRRVYEPGLAVQGRAMSSALLGGMVRLSSSSVDTPFRRK
jgi:hypothetical protein